MKIYLIALALALTALFKPGTPLSTARPAIEHRWQSPEPILPMTFAHEDHVSENCLVCHHNYADDTGGDQCMTCHVTNQEVWPQLEVQFHELCRGCHEERQLAGEDGGPTRACIKCHMDEQVP